MKKTILIALFFGVLLAPLACKKNEAPSRPVTASATQTMTTTPTLTVTETSTLTPTATQTSTPTPTATVTVTYTPTSTPALSSFAVAAPSSVLLGSTFSVTVTAQDTAGGTFTADAGVLSFHATDSMAFLPADDFFSGGVRIYQFILRTAGPQRVEVTLAADSSIHGGADVTVLTP